MTAVQASKIKVSMDPPPLGVPYVKLEWSALPGHLLKEGAILNTFDFDDEFYDRTNFSKQKTKQGEAVQVVETAETLLEERDVLAKEMDVVLVELQAEEAKSNTKEESNVTSESIDPLDAFVSSLSTNIVKDKIARLKKELSKLQAEADRIFRLLKIADPSGDAAQKWDGKAEGSSQSQKVESILENWLRVRANKEIARELASQSKEALNSASEIPAPSTANVSDDSVDPKAETEELPVVEVAGDQLGSEGRELPALMTEFMVDMNRDGRVKSVRTKLEPVDGVKSADVSLENQVVRILGSTTVKDLTAASVESGRKARFIGQGLPETQEEAQEQQSRSRNSLQQQQQPAGTETRGMKKRKLEPGRPPAVADASGCEFVEMASSTASQPRAAGPQDPKPSVAAAETSEARSKNLKLVFVTGGPGSGKGTQYTRIVENFGFEHLSAGDLLRIEQNSDTDMGNMIKGLINEGKSVPSETIVKLILKAIADSPNNKFLIDGLPRNDENREVWDRVAAVKPEFILFSLEEEKERRVLSRNEINGLMPVNEVFAQIQPLVEPIVQEELMQANIDLSEGLDTGHPAVTVSEPQSQRQTASSPQLGRMYTRPEIHKMLGGGVQQFLPTKDGRVVCGCFRLQWNPLAPEEVLLGPGPGETTAAMAVRQGGRLPIFLRRAVHAWEYVGDYRATRYVEREEAGCEAKARWAEARDGRNDLVGVLYMEKA